MASGWRIAVAGGSLGGLSAALVLRDLGADVTVYERSPAELEQRGAGIGFLPASSRYLVERAGLELDRISTRTARIRYLARDGAVVHDEAHIYRFSSWNTVYRHLLQCFGRERYELGGEVTGFEVVEDEVRVALAGGAADHRRPARLRRGDRFRHPPPAATGRRAGVRRLRGLAGHGPRAIAAGPDRRRAR